jgi:hypothetical protein
MHSERAAGRDVYSQVPYTKLVSPPAGPSAADAVDKPF